MGSKGFITSQSRTGLLKLGSVPLRYTSLAKHYQPLIGALGESLISWNLDNTEERQNSWHFPSFEVQEYLLPIINVGGQNFDEYGVTKYAIEDCRRLINTITFAKETMSLMSKSVVRYETIEDGLASLDKDEIISTLDKLARAAELAIKKETSLLFFGD